MDPIEALRIRGIGVGKKLVGDAQAGDVRAGKTFSNAQGNDKQGTLPVRSTVAQTVTPGVNNIIKQAGIYDGDITIQGDVNLTAVNIISGKSIFGVAGTFTGKRYATGTATTNSSTLGITVTGLAFTPRIIIAKGTYRYILDSTVNSTTTYKIGAAGTYTGGSVSSNGFSLMTDLGNQVLNWEAFE